MVFPLQYSNLEEAYPEWCKSQPDEHIPMFIPSSSRYSEESPPEYVDVDPLEIIANKIKPFEKLRIVNGNLEIDKRFPLRLRRKITGDSRKKIMEKLKTYPKTSPLIKIVELLCTTTYKNDKHFLQEMKNYLYENLVRNQLKTKFN